MVTITIPGGIGVDLMLLGIALWILGVILPLAKIKLGELKAIGKFVLIVGAVLFVVQLIIP
jgi:hypothetical protein